MCQPNREAFCDVIWRVRFRDQWVYIYLLLEFQSSVDRFMALRLMVYVGLLYQHLVRETQIGAGALLPPVLPIVLNNGLRRWTAPRDVAQLVWEVPGQVVDYRPRMPYLLLEERAWDASQLERMENLAAAIFRLEQSRSREDIERVMASLGQWLQTPDRLELARSIVNWLARVLVPQRMADSGISGLGEVEEYGAMLYERARQWERQWREESLREGRVEGRVEGREEGLVKGQANALLQLMEQKFGPLSDLTRRRIEEADSQQLLTWTGRILDARAPEDVIA